LITEYFFRVRHILEQFPSQETDRVIVLAPYRFDIRFVLALPGVKTSF